MTFWDATIILGRYVSDEWIQSSAYSMLKRQSSTCSYSRHRPIRIAEKNHRYFESSSLALNGEIPLNPPLVEGGCGDLPGNDGELVISDGICGNCYVRPCKRAKC